MRNPALGFLPALVLGLLVTTAGWADPVVHEAVVKAENRSGKTWNRLTGRVEVVTDLTPDQILNVIQDWESYPRLFPNIRSVGVVRQEGVVLLSEVVVVSALGFQVTNRFTLRLKTSIDAASGQVTVSWTQEATDGTIDSLEGGWVLVPQTGATQPRTLVRYATTSAVPETFPGQAGVVGAFYPGELKKIVSTVVDEARKKSRRS